MDCCFLSMLQNTSCFTDSSGSRENKGVFKVHILQSQKKMLQYLKKYELSDCLWSPYVYLAIVLIFMLYYWNKTFSDFLGQGLCMYVLEEGEKRNYSTRYVQFQKYRCISKKVFVYMKDLFCETNVSFSCKGRPECFIPYITHWKNICSDCWLNPA